MRTTQSQWRFANSNHAGIRNYKPAQNPHEGGFSCPVFADYSMNLAGKKLCRNFRERLNGAEALADSFDVDASGHGGNLPLGGRWASGVGLRKWRNVGIEK